jgi:hypothetical protein
MFYCSSIYFHDGKASFVEPLVTELSDHLGLTKDNFWKNYNRTFIIPVSITIREVNVRGQSIQSLFDQFLDRLPFSYYNNSASYNVFRLGHLRKLKNNGRRPVFMITKDDGQAIKTDIKPQHCQQIVDQDFKEITYSPAQLEDLLDKYRATDNLYVLTEELCSFLDQAHIKYKIIQEPMDAFISLSQ